MDRVAAITEADIAWAPTPKPSPDITASAVGGNRLRFRRLDFVLKFTVLLLRSIAYASELDPVDCAER